MVVRLSLQSQNFRRAHRGGKDISILFISSVGALGQSGGRCRLINYMEDGEEVGRGQQRGGGVVGEQISRHVATLMRGDTLALIKRRRFY